MDLVNFAADVEDTVTVHGDCPRAERAIVGDMDGSLVDHHRAGEGAGLVS